MDSLGVAADGRLAPISAAVGGVTVAGVIRSATRLARILDIQQPPATAPDVLAAAFRGFVEAAAASNCVAVRAELAAGDPDGAALLSAGSWVIVFQTSSGMKIL